jgi:alginate O-acetyltransferase complex protein AlgI
MLFCTKPFLLFFAIVFAVYWAMPWQRGRVAWLLAASFCFYATWNRWLACVVFMSASLDYLLARGMGATTRPRRRQLLLVASLVANLGLLVYFKYANFFLRSLEDALAAAGHPAALPVLKVILPVGISFYTFEAINYTVDVYRRRIPAERNLAHFLLFILFFPHLVAGPIVRAGDFLPQVHRPKRWNWPRLRLGARLVLLGLFKKLAIADRMGLFADPVFRDPGAYGSAALWMAALAYSLQLYCDFSGYSDMALGTAHMLGYKLARNFDMPYLSANITEFWRRWHISLSSWIRDYLFVPLGGSRGGAAATARNLLIAMTLSGLWHGAGWTYVLWGLIHGVMLCGHRGFQTWARRRPGLATRLQSVPGTGLRIAVTFACVCGAFVIFRCETLAHAGTMVAGMLLPRAGSGVPLPARALWLTVAVVVLAHLAGREPLRRRLLEDIPLPVRGLGYGIILSLALVLAPDTTRAFIYFQF